MKKKILIVSHALELGGAERSLIGLLDALDTEKYEIDLFLLRHEGELMDAIPKGIHLLPEVPAYTVLARPMKQTLKEGHVLLTLARLCGKVSAGIYKRKYGFKDSGVALEYSHKYTCRFMPEIQKDTEYDLAISFLTPHYFVAEKVKAKKKIAWIHTDYSKVQVNVESEYKMWNAYDYIASISDNVTESFLSVFNGLEKKIIKIENILSEKLTRKQAEENICTEFEGRETIKILSIGRYCVAKNFDNVPNICKRILEKGINVIWYIIGFGGDEELIEEKIHGEGMEEYVILLGKKDNPYPYIEACDLYVQPSRYEGKSVTVREAQMLGKPVVITRYPTSSSQLEDGVDGVIVELDNEACAEGIVVLLKDKEKMQMLSKNCSERDYSNKSEVNKIYELL